MSKPSNSKIAQQNSSYYAFLFQHYHNLETLASEARFSKHPCLLSSPYIIKYGTQIGLRVLLVKRLLIFKSYDMNVRESPKEGRCLSKNQSRAFLGKRLSSEIESCESSNLLVILSMVHWARKWLHWSHRIHAHLFLSNSAYLYDQSSQVDKGTRVPILDVLIEK